MKVNIGPYRSGNYFFHKLFDFWISKTHKVGFSWEVEFANYTPFDRILEKTCNGLQVAMNVLFNNWYENIPRKQVVKLHHSDTWSADHTLALVILPVLKQLRATKHGSPWVDDEDVPEELRSTSAPPKENEWDTDDNHHKRWDYVLDEMIWAFEQCADPDSHYAHYDKITGWDMEKRNASRDRKNKGLILFGKYYEALWD